MAHVRFFDEPASLDTFFKAVHCKAHWHLIGAEEDIKRPINQVVPLYNILLDLPTLKHTAWLIITLDEHLLKDDRLEEWFKGESFLEHFPSHMDVLFVVQPEDPMLSLERVVNDQVSELQTTKASILPRLAAIIETTSLYRNRYYYLFTPDILIHQYETSTTNTSDTGDNPFDVAMFSKAKTAKERHFTMIKYSLEFIPSNWLNNVVGWIAGHWSHVFPRLGCEQKQLRNNTNSCHIYCDLDRSPQQFISVLIKI